ncbi:LxmA leader domain family RiPP [Streptomyces pristinaespiralis]|jgi:hypothetical protein|uniref:Uncharacterized protein n=3 Tax=Streptomyces TaxID=1883 RepID=B5H653_STRE2|nr:LxmA leader domain family RiPP [Streptomyces pristinaespiralis]ALC22073.1 hypothetical protein SPRI_3767 [Streptomyces pristinaespiralis]EDY62314.1 conserved hypothetical protein [Streptomyces pristinaespiralis ATCC 25486]QMU15280.1 hypothetical protein H3L99_18160 [Streptomyces pristinaespiralis]
MDKTGAITELIEGYDSYSDAEELNSTAAAEAPATSAPCGAASVSWLASQFTVKTYKEGC